MVSYNQNKNTLEVNISVPGICELYDYQKGLLGILGEIQINDCDELLKENLKSVYKLLGHLLLDSNFLKQHESLLQEYKALIVQSVDGKVQGS
ncbi:MAG: hypothetical protein ABJF04_18530 [Reichenbachiella sp.]|uniref:hypothetical protein n=1 Tax=Reichenbachiella sp. TaxID=2184521 RepID=UPI00326535A9